MASTFKNLSPDDKISTKTLLHEAIPITGTIVSGTYADNNIKNYSHGMFQSVYDYPYLSSSANHIFDITVGMSNSSALSSSTSTAAAQRTKKINLYNQMAQVLVGYDKTGSVQLFDEDGDLSAGDKLNECIFLSFSRLLVKDEIKKGSFNLELGVNGDYATPFTKRIKVIDESAATSFKINSPVGEYGILVADSTTGTNLTNDTGSLASGVKCGLIFYQAGVVVLSGSVFDTSVAIAAETTFTFGSGFGGTDNGTITITDYANTAVVYKIRQGGAATGVGQFNCGASKAAAAENFCQVVEHATNGHNGTIFGFDSAGRAWDNGSKDFSDGVVILKQQSATATHHLGNTKITTAASFDNTTSVNASTFTGGGSATGILSSSVGAPQMTSDTFANSFQSLLTGSSISGSADALRHRIYNLSFNNTVELNSTIYFCRINHNEYNYSSNPTYLSSSQIRVKTNSTDNPVSYVTTVGLYSADNQLLAVGKLSEPLRKDPTLEYTLRARLDY